MIGAVLVRVTWRALAELDAVRRDIDTLARRWERVI